MTYWHHPEIEEKTIGTVLKHDYQRPCTKWHLTFDDSREYICFLFTDFESDNSGDLDITENDPRYDEFYEVVFEVIEVINGVDDDISAGELLPITYRSFPTRITDADTGEVIYPAPTDTTIPSQD